MNIVIPMRLPKIREEALGNKYPSNIVTVAIAMLWIILKKPMFLYFSVLLNQRSLVWVTPAKKIDKGTRKI